MAIPNWVKGLAVLWGAEVSRFDRELGNIHGTLGKIEEEGPVGAAIRSYPDSDRIPYREMSENCRTFHRCWLDMKPMEKAVLWIDYARPGKTNLKIKRTGLSKGKYYSVRNSALEKITREWHLYAEKPPE